ncbi:MAG: M28 family peptidase [Clostridiales bacterium]|nr:M28 family peptidase [Clostridiales bacterium]
MYLLRKRKITMLKILVVFIVLNLTLLGCESKEDLSFREINTERVKEHIEVLVSDEFEGRMIGTDGNEKTVEYIVNQFKEIGLEPHIKNEYITTFNTIKPVLEKPVVFNVVDSDGNVVREFIQGKEFLVRFDDFAMGGKFTGSLYHIITDEALNSTDDLFEGLAILADFEDKSIMPTGFTQSDALRRLRRENAEVIIYRESRAMNSRNINLGRKNQIRTTTGPVIIGVSDDAYNELVQFYNQGYKITIDSSLKFADVKANNVFGVIPTANTSYENYIMIATSFDGLGIDEQGKMHKSKTDNASGVATLLEVASYIKENNMEFDSTIIFAAFNGKHTGHVGVSHYNTFLLYPPDRTQVIFIDNITGVNEAIFTLGSFETWSSQKGFNHSTIQTKRLSNIANALDIASIIDMNYFRAEHSAFRNNGVVATVISTMPAEGYVASESDINSITNNSEHVSNIIINFLNQHSGLMIINELTYPLRKFAWVFVLIIVFAYAKFRYFKKNDMSENKYKFDIYKGKSILDRIMMQPIVSGLSVAYVFLMISTITARHVLSNTKGVPLEEAYTNFSSLMQQFLRTIFTAPILLYMLVFTYPLFLVLFMALIIKFVFNKASTSLHCLLVAIAIGLPFYFYTTKTIVKEYTMLFPEILSTTNAPLFVVLCLILLSLGLSLLYSYEYKIKRGHGFKSRILLSTLLIFLAFYLILLGPNLFSADMVELFRLGVRVRL